MIDGSKSSRTKVLNKNRLKRQRPGGFSQQDDDDLDALALIGGNLCMLHETAINRDHHGPQILVSVSSLVILTERAILSALESATVLI